MGARAGLFLVPTFSGDPPHPISPNSKNDLDAGSVSSSSPPAPEDKCFVHIQFQVRAFVLYAKFILASAQLVAGEDSTEVSQKSESVAGAAML